MLHDLRISVIGAGAMGGAILTGLLDKELVAPEQIIATDTRAERRDELFETLGIGVSDDNVEAAAWGDVVIFAVKPQVLPRVLPPLRGTLRKRALALSIVAGTPISTYTQALEHDSVVRAMPNTPAQISAGMTVWTASPAVDDQQYNWTRLMLSTLGAEIYVESENHLNMATAINGSGPAYVFLFIESLIDAAVRMGLSRHIAEQLVIQTVLGSTTLLQESELHPAELRNRVTSPGGTTAAALRELERGALRAVIDNAVQAAYMRAQELGKSE